MKPTAAQHCSGTAEPDLQTALDAAKTAPNDTHPNTVVVGDPGPVPSSGYSYQPSNPAANPVAIVGAGQRLTTLTFSVTSYSTVLDLEGDGSSVSNLTVQVPASGGTGIFLAAGARATGVHVTSPATQTPAGGLVGVQTYQGSTTSASGSAFTDSSISFPTSGSGHQLSVDVHVGSLVEDDSISGQGTGISFTGNGHQNASTLRRVRTSLTAPPSVPATGLDVELGASVEADNVAISLSGGGQVTGVTNVDASLTLNQLSVSGNSGTGSTGVYDFSDVTPGTVAVRNSIIRNFAVGTYRKANGSGTANVRYDYSDYDAGDQQDAGGSGAITSGVGNLDNIDPRWWNPAVGDFTLPAGSPVINRGDPAPLNAAVESTTDSLGRPRVSGGRRDMGAVEYQFPPRFQLAANGSFNPRSGKVSVKARCLQAAGDHCAFQLKLRKRLTIRATITEARHRGHRHHRSVSVTLTGTVAGGGAAFLHGTLSRSARTALAHASHIRMSVSGTVTDQVGSRANAAGHITLTPKKRHRHHHH